MAYVPLSPNFYQVISCISRLNHLYGLQLDHHDINFMYSLCGNDRSGYYLKVRDARVRLISCLPDSNKNSVGEFVRVGGNWYANKLTCSTSPRNIGRSMHVNFDFVIYYDLFISTTIYTLTDHFHLPLCRR